VTPQAFAKVKKRPSRRVQNWIAAALGTRAEIIWPERYRQNGARR
jgi:lambda repressor-like predicted transcriptional regulator